MICDYGMTDMGPIALGEKEDQIFLGREIANHRDFSEKTAEEIDTLMKKIINEQEERAIEILTQHRDKLELLANALIEHELLDKEEIDKILSGDILEKAKKNRDKDLPLTQNFDEDSVKISPTTEFSAEHTSCKYLDDTILNNEKMIADSKKTLESAQDLLALLEAQIDDEKRKSPVDKEKIKSFERSAKKICEEIKLHNRNIKFAQDIVFNVKRIKDFYENPNTSQVAGDEISINDAEEK
jgi:hypothetical protein